MRVANQSGMNQIPDNIGSAGPAPKPQQHFLALLSEFGVANVITRGRAGEGSLHGRPMAIAKVEDDGTLWFVTSVDSPKVLEIRDDSRAMISLQNSRQFVSINGHLELVTDRAKVDELWKESYRVWFEGEHDPELVLLRFTPFDAEFWDNAGARGVKYAFEAAKAYLKGQKMDPSEFDPEAHARLQL